MEVDLQSRNYTLPMSALGNLKLETRSWEGTKPGHPFSTILSYQFPQIGGLIAVPSFRWFVALLDVYLVVMMHMFFYVLLTFSVTGALDPIKKQDGLQIIHSWPKSLHCHEKEFLRKIRPPPLPRRLAPFSMLLERLYSCTSVIWGWCNSDLGRRGRGQGNKIFLGQLNIFSLFLSMVVVKFLLSRFK